jgi:aspartate aminotransferase
MAKATVAEPCMSQYDNPHMKQAVRRHSRTPGDRMEGRRMAIAKKIQQYMQTASWIRAMFEEGLRLKQEHGEDQIFDFSLGNPIMEPPAQFYEVLAELVQHPRAGMHRYMPNAGYPATRNAIAQQLASETGTAFTANHIVMVVGAAGGLNVVLKALLDPGDEVIVFSPYFVEYGFYIDNHQGVTNVIPTDAQFNLDLQALEQALSPKTKVVLINSPNNPSGVVYSTANRPPSAARFTWSATSPTRSCYTMV